MAEMDLNSLSSGLNTTDAMVEPLRPDALQIFHVIFLILICLLGTIGNVMTIIAVKIERELREALPNLFVINLAVADLIVCGCVVPILIVHDIHAERLLGPVLCYATAAVSGIACHTAAGTMTCIAVTRYIAASRTTNYHEILTKKRICIVILAVWLFAAANTALLLLAWIDVSYDVTKYVCVCYDGTFKLHYTLVPIIVGHFLLHAVTIYCYYAIMRTMRTSRRKITYTAPGMTTDNQNSVDDMIEKNTGKQTVVVNIDTEPETPAAALSVSNWTRHEIQLLKTSMWIIGFFSFCWIPNGFLVLLQDLAPIELKKAFATLCLLSFSLNPVIYGLLSKAFKKAYLRIMKKILCGFCGQSDGIYSYSSHESSSAVVNEAQKSPRARKHKVDDVPESKRLSLYATTRVM